MRAPLLSSLVALLLAACASTAAPVYGPAAGAGRAGYTDIRIEEARWRVAYRAPGGADPATLETFALRRAAEITLQNGYEWFIVDERETEAAAASGPRLSIGVGGGGYGGSGGVGVGARVGVPIGREEARAAAAILHIRLGGGARPADANAYDAASVLSAQTPTR